MLRPLSLVLLGAACAMALTIDGEATFDRNRLAFGERDGITFVSLERYPGTCEAGAPALPIAVAQYVVPPDMRVTGVTVTEVEAETIGTFDIYPAQQPRAPWDPGPLEFSPPDPKYYGSTYPAAVATAGYQGSMSGYNIASVIVAPVQYNGTEKSLTFQPRVRFAIELEPADLGYLRPGNRSPEARRRIETHIAGIVLNPQDIAACAPR